MRVAMADSNHVKKRRVAQVAGQKRLPSHPHDHHLTRTSPCEIHYCHLDDDVPMSVQTLEEPNSLPRLAANSKRISRSLSRPNIRCAADVGGGSRRPEHSLSPFMPALGGASRRMQNGEHQRDANLGATKTVTATTTRMMQPPKIPERSRTADPTVRRSRARMYSDSTRFPVIPSAPNDASSPIPPAPSYPPPVEYHSSSSHFSRGSGSVASESTDSSPTTASSTFDSPIIVDQSPSSSPESPSSVIPLSSMKPSAHCVSGDAHAKPPPSDTLLPPMRPDSPRKGARNLKNLSLKLAPPQQTRPSLSTAPVVGERPGNISAPSSPIHPISKPSSRRKQPNLTIQTPVLAHSSTDIGQLVPPTPTSKPTLRHFESSPSLNSLQSPTQATFPSLSSQLHSAQQPDVDNSQQSSSRPGFNRNGPLQALGEEDDCPISRESSQGNDKGYPDGPICIYDSGLYLYLEPNREEASKFDVVFNVAKEIANPFKGNSKQSSSVDKSAPEYIHVPWDHNSEILDDLYTLCEMIDERISKGKSVLIHCQLGVSRSASLVIAYGLYKNPTLDFNSIYGIVKGRSCWVGPNMSLIYQLTDFRSRVQRGGPTKPPPHEWFGESESSLPSQPSSIPNESISLSSQRQQQSVPEQQEQQRLSISTIFSPPTSLQERLCGEVPSFLHQDSSTRPLLPATTRRNNMPCRPLPLREKYQPIQSLRPHTARAEASGMSLSERSVSQPTKQTGLAKQDEASEPNLDSIFSPTEGNFPNAQRLSHHRNSAAGDLAFPRDSIDLSTLSTSSSCNTVQPPAVAVDPRSPQQKREPLIMRNIDEFL